jgi:hypothetical protein
MSSLQTPLYRKMGGNIRVSPLPWGITINFYCLHFTMIRTGYMTNCSTIKKRAVFKAFFPFSMVLSSPISYIKNSVFALRERFLKLIVC